MREIDVSVLTEAIAEGFREINLTLSPDMQNALENAGTSETNPLGKEILGMIQKNTRIAKEDGVPICQDTGMAILFMDVGQDVHFTGGELQSAINAGVRKGYTEGYLRKSIVADPINRVNTGDNTPCIVHTAIVPGDKVKLTLTAKGFGSENTSRLFMLKPAEGLDGIKKAVVTAVKDAGPNACPPMVVGVGIGGNFEKCAILAKYALTREVGVHSSDEQIAALETELLDEINALGIGPAGFGGNTTALGVNIETFPTHIAGLPVAVNICCHVNRHKTIEI